MKKSDEEQWSLKQKLISFEVERKSFEKEKQFIRHQIAVEQEKVQVNLMIKNLSWIIHGIPRQNTESFCSLRFFSFYFGK